jgi:hypothetical protein
MWAGSERWFRAGPLKLPHQLCGSARDKEILESVRCELDRVTHYLEQAAFPADYNNHEGQVVGL